MQEITKRLQEQKQVALAKKILESAGYTITKGLKESSNTTSGYEYIENPEDYEGPYQQPRYEKVFSNDIIGTVYPPNHEDDEHLQDMNHDDFIAEVYDNNKAEVIVGPESFDHLQSATNWISMKVKYLTRNQE